MSATHPLPAASTLLGVASQTPASQLEASTLQESRNYGWRLISRQECIDNIVLEYGITMGLTKRSLYMKCIMSQLAVVRGAGAKSHVKGTN